MLGAITLLRKRLYFYMKVENNTEFIRENGRPYWCLDYYNDKMLVFDSDGKTVSAVPNSMYLIPPNTPTMIKSSNLKPWTHTTITFDADETFMESLAIPYMTPIHIGNTKELEQLMFEMEHKQISASKFKQDAQDAYLLLILTCVHDLLHISAKDYKTEAGDDLQKIRHTVMSSTGVFWTLERMAAMANMSVRGFQRKYKQIYGKTPIADLYDFRFTRSKRLLETGYSINHIMNSCGFKSAEHFSRFFKKRAGMTPTEYRNKTK